MGAAKTRTNATTRMGEDDPRARPYARYAILNPYNLVVFAGGVSAGLLTGHGWLVVITCAAEVLWMIFAPDSRLLRSLWFDRAFDVETRISVAERRKERAARLAGPDSVRLVQLFRQKQLIERLAKENASLAVELLGDELAKLDALVDDFIELGISAARGEEHGATYDFVELRRSWGFYEQQLHAYTESDPRRAVAAKNLEVLRQRRRRYDDLGRCVQVSRGQMDLIEQTFRLLGDEIMTMASPHELGGRLDELRVAVDAVRETAVDDYVVLEVEEARLTERSTVGR